jgi:hypothetical protein
MDTQLFMLQLQQNPTVWRIAHTHAYTAYEYTGEKNYFAEAFATINKAGSTVYFGSNWGDFTTDYTDTYQVTLPSEWNVIAPGFTPSATSAPTTSATDGQENTPLPENYIVLTVAAVIIAAVVAFLLMRRRGTDLHHPRMKQNLRT